MIDAGMVARDDRAMCHVVAVRLLETPTCRRRAGFCRGDLFPQGKASVVVSGLAGQAIFRVELGNDEGRQRGTAADGIPLSDPRLTGPAALYPVGSRRM